MARGVASTRGRRTAARGATLSRLAAGRPSARAKCLARIIFLLVARLTRAVQSGAELSFGAGLVRTEFCPDQCCCSSQVFQRRGMRAAELVGMLLGPVCGMKKRAYLLVARD